MSSSVSALRRCRGGRTEGEPVSKPGDSITPAAQPHPGHLTRPQSTRGVRSRILDRAVWTPPTATQVTRFGRARAHPTRARRTRVIRRRRRRSGRDPSRPAADPPVRPRGRPGRWGRRRRSTSAARPLPRTRPAGRWRARPPGAGRRRRGEKRRGERVRGVIGTPPSARLMRSPSHRRLEPARRAPSEPPFGYPHSARGRAAAGAVVVLDVG